MTNCETCQVIKFLERQGIQLMATGGGIPEAFCFVFPSIYLYYFDVKEF
jgi:hypothetical protein